MVTQPTDHCWRQQYGGMQNAEARRLTQLEKGRATRSKSLWGKTIQQKP